MLIAFFGSSILSSYWNGAATYYRGLLKSLAACGYDITFYEPDAYGRQQHRDADSYPFVKSVVYSGEDLVAVQNCLRDASNSDIVIKASGVGVFDAFLERAVAESFPRAVTTFWDVDAPATLERTFSNESDPFRALIPRYDAVLTYGGGTRVVEAYESLGARMCVPVYNAVDRDTHFPVPYETDFSSCISFQGNRLPDREERVDEFFFTPARLLPYSSFLLGGNGWQDKAMPSNVRYCGHVGTGQHNAFNSSAQFVLNINRESMATYGFSPATRVFEAAAAAACVITDAWEGVGMFLQPGEEILVARDGREVSDLIRTVPEERSRSIGEAAKRRILAEHTYQHRAALVDELFRSLCKEKASARSASA